MYQNISLQIKVMRRRFDPDPKCQYLHLKSTTLIFFLSRYCLFFVCCVSPHNCSYCKQHLIGLKSANVVYKLSLASISNNVRFFCLYWNNLTNKRYFDFLLKGRVVKREKNERKKKLIPAS